MVANCRYNKFYKVFAKLTKAKSSLITFKYLKFLESFFSSLRLLTNSSDIVYHNIKEISKKYQRNIKEISKKYKYFILYTNYFYIIINLKFPESRFAAEGLMFKTFLPLK